MGISKKLFGLLFGAAKAPKSAHSDSPLLEDWIFANNYRVLNKMGFGGSACVLRATDLSLKREVALKVLLESEETDTELANRFLAEGRTLASIQHPNIVTVYSLGVDDRLKFPFLVMEMVKGATLADHLEDYRAKPLRLIRDMITVFESIHYCHQKQVIHLDLKPSNIMIDQKGQIKIIDFGIAQGASYKSTSPFILGTVYYMAPEQFLGDAHLSYKTDIYALGVVLWELLTGKPPFVEGKDCRDPFDDLQNSHCEQQPPLEQISSLPQAGSLAPLLSRLLAKNPADRPEIPHIIQFLREELVTLGGMIGDRYEVLEVIDHQRAIRHLKSRDKSLNRLVCIDMLSSEFSRKPETVHVFLSRAEKLVKAQLPIFPLVYSIDYEPTTRLPHLVRELINGVSLGAVFPAFQTAPLRVLNIFLNIVQELIKCHEAGIGHGNLKTSHIFLDSHDRPTLLGFDFLISDGEAISRDLKAIVSLAEKLFEPLITSWPPEAKLPGPRLELRQLIDSWREAANPPDLPTAAKELEPICNLFAAQDIRDAREAPDAGNPQTVLGTLIQEKLSSITELDMAENSQGIAVLVKALEEEKDPTVISAILPVIARLERRSELPLILPYLDHEDPRVRISVLEAISISGEIGACLQIFDLLKDPDTQVRVRAASTLKNFGTDRLTDQLQTFALFGLPLQQVKAIEALQYYPNEEHLTLLQLLIQSNDEDVARAAQDGTLSFLTKGLEHFTPQAALAPLTRSRIEDMKGHTIVCGYGRKGQILVNSLLEKNQECVVIETDPIQSGLEFAKARGIPTLPGSAKHAVVLISAGVTRAKYVLAVTNDDETNLEIALKVKILLGNVPRPPDLPPLQCLTHVFSPALKSMTSIFHQHHQRRPTRFEGLTSSPGFEFRLFNVFENAARQILTQYPPPLRSFKQQLQGKPLHILIIGLSPLGANLVAHAALMLQGTTSDQLHITVVDSAKNFKTAAFRFHFPRIDRAVSLNLVPIDQKNLNPGAIERLASLEAFSAVYLCLSDADQNKDLAGQLRNQDWLPLSVPILYVGKPLPESGSTSSEVAGCVLYDVFGSTCIIDAITQEPLDELARAIHQHTPETAPDSSTRAPTNGNTSWERLRGDVKEHYRAQADHLKIKLKSIGCTIVPAGKNGTPHQPSAADQEIMCRMERQRRVVEALLSTPDVQDTQDFSSQSDLDEFSHHVQAIPGILNMIGLKIQLEKL